MKFDIHKKEREGWLYENSEGKKNIGNSKLKLWTFIWGHGEREWPLITSHKHCKRQVKIAVNVIVKSTVIQ